MRPRTLGVLFVLVAGLLAFIWLYERDLPSSEERVELARRVLRLEPDEVLGVTLDRGEVTVRFERLEGAQAEDEAEAEIEWRLREPLDAAADRFAVEQLVDRLTGLEKERTLEEADAAALGLDEPRGRVTLETAGDPIELVVGSPVPASSTMILTVSGRQEAYVVSDSLWQDLEKPAGDWRSRDLGPGDREAIQRIALGSGEGAVSLGRRGESFWVESPYVDKADGDLASALLGEITGLRAESFVDGPVVAGVPEARFLEVVLEGREQALRIEMLGAAGEEGELELVRVDGQVIEARTELAEMLERGAEEWRSRAWASLQVYQIDRLTARDATGETLFERDGGDWLRDGAAVRYEPVSELLYALTGIEAEAVSASTAAPGEAVLTFELSGGEGEPGETLELFAAGDDGVSPARVAGREVTLRLAEGAVADLQLKLSEARSAAEPSLEDAGELEPLSEDS